MCTTSHILKNETSICAAKAKNGGWGAGAHTRTVPILEYQPSVLFQQIKDHKIVKALPSQKMEK